MFEVQVESNDQDWPNPDHLPQFGFKGERWRLHQALTICHPSPEAATDPYQESLECAAVGHQHHQHRHTNFSLGGGHGFQGFSPTVRHCSPAEFSCPWVKRTTALGRWHRLSNPREERSALVGFSSSAMAGWVQLVGQSPRTPA